jgi:MerR family mercuric resistance operon transcriptional regulator
MSAPEVFPIGILSKRSGVNIESIRYYERVDLLRKPARSTGGYRLYRSGDIDRLCFIRRARDLGFSLDEIRRLLDLADQKSRSCRRVHDIAAEHLAEVRMKIEHLQRMERVLADMVKTCAQGTMPICPLLETLTQAANRH